MFLVVFSLFPFTGIEGWTGEQEHRHMGRSLMTIHMFEACLEGVWRRDGGRGWQKSPPVNSKTGSPSGHPSKPFRLLFVFIFLLKLKGKFIWFCCSWYVTCNDCSKKLEWLIKASKKKTRLITRVALYAADQTKTELTHAIRFRRKKRQ